MDLVAVLVMPAVHLRVVIPEEGALNVLHGQDHSNVELLAELALGMVLENVMMLMQQQRYHPYQYHQLYNLWAS